MQMREHMANIVKFVYLIIVFLSIFVVVTDGVTKCRSNKDCRKQMSTCLQPRVPRCIQDACECW
ncbi:unnamed protein product [Lathyrus oleraceus]